MTEDKRKPGRQALPPAEKLEVVPIRLNQAQKAKLQRIGVQRLREWLDRVRDTPEQRQAAADALKRAREAVRVVR